MTTTWMVCVLLLGACFADSANSPQTLEPGEEYAYPENYCENFDTRDHFDFVVVGAGPAGSAVARRLAEIESFNVLLIEAGGDPPPESDIPGNIGLLPMNNYWNFRTTPIRNGGCQGFVGKSCPLKFGQVLGGSSTVGYTLNIRGNKVDFDEIAALGNPGWSYNEILPYFKKSETCRGISIGDGNTEEERGPSNGSSESTCLEEDSHEIRGPSASSESALAGSIYSSSESSLAGENPDRIDASSESTLAGGIEEGWSDNNSNENSDSNVSKYHGLSGPIMHNKFPIDPYTNPLREALMLALKDVGFKYNPDYNGQTQRGYADIFGSIDELGYRYSAAKGYLTNIPKNLKVCTNSLAKKLIFKGKNATGLEFYSIKNGQPKKMMAKASKEYIISGGTYNTPALLERSGIGRKEVLKKFNIKEVQVLNAVGENINNHFINLASAYKVGDMKSVASPNPLSIQLGSLAAFYNNSDYDSDVIDTKVFFHMYNPHDKTLSDFTPEIKTQLAEAGHVLLAGGVAQRGNPPGSTHISHAKDPRISPTIAENPFSSKQAVTRIIDEIRIKRKFLMSPALKDFKIEPIILKECQKYELNSDKEILCGAKLLTRPSYHGVGSSSMGPTSDRYVVNSRLSIHGIGNVRVIDSSILPLVLRGPPEAASYAIGEKGADMLKEDYGVLQTDGESVDDNESDVHNVSNRGPY